MGIVISSISRCLSWVPSCLAACWARAVLFWKACTSCAFIGERVPAFETIHFLLHKGTPGQEEVLEEVAEAALQPGDMVLFPLNEYGSCSSLFTHAAVYLGEAEVIHFQNTDVRRNIGQICKEGFHALKRARGKCQMYRKRGGMDLKEFHSNVREAMKSTGSYHPGTNNCIHFALWLLGLEDFYMDLVEISDADGRERLSSCSVM
ncbi:uncharacterized protein LOC128972302 [Indicator indicator]|uniref:uncharacterized protein LOC128972302 n=1 Tax=Indicator indicator TaxID=1002788 RepID=UPI0023E027D6|nr:uncharacterized protein LOC128972302 [Indicator indicator]